MTLAVFPPLPTTTLRLALPKSISSHLRAVISLTLKPAWAPKSTTYKGADALIRTRFHEPLSTSSVARTLHCNPDYLGRVFHKVYGCTLTEALHGRRLKVACRLLLESDATVEKIAVSCGFRDATYFRRLFKRREGVSPRAFRQLYAKQHVNTE